MKFVEKIRKLIRATIKRIEIQHVHSQQIITVKSAEEYRNDNKNSNSIETESEALRVYRSIWNFIIILGAIVGVNAYNNIEIDLKFRVAFTLAVIAVAYPSLFYTMALVWPNIPALLEVVCIFGVLMPATFKYFLALTQAKHIRHLKIFVESVLIKNSKGSRSKLLEKEMKGAFTKVKIFTALFLMCFAIFSLYPIYAYIVENRLVAIMRIEFPFVDQSDMNGYLIALAIMLLFGIMAVAGSVAFDLMVTMVLLSYGSLVTLFAQDVTDYHEMWQNNATFSDQHREYFLRNILLKFQDINRYIRYVNELLAATTCNSICILYGSLICSVYAVINNGWISGYGFRIFCFVQLYIPCMLGTYVSDQNEKLNQVLYFTLWYEYPIEVQKTFLVLMHASSFNSMELWIGPFAPLNVRTGLQMTKNIYSYTTAMKNLT